MRRAPSWTLAHFRNVLDSYPNSPIIVAGDSAGSNLTVALAQGLNADERARINALFVLYAWLDLTRVEADYPNNKEEVLLRADLIPLASERFAGDTPLDDPMISPLYGEVGNLPHIHVITGDKDMLHQDSLDFLKRVKNKGGSIDVTNHTGYGHDFWLFPTPDGARETRNMAALMKASLQS